MSTRERTPTTRTMMDLAYDVADLNADPESRTNKDGAAEGALICDFIEHLTGTSETGDQITDVLTQLMHFCDQSRFDFDACLTAARLRFQSETQEDG